MTITLKKEEARWVRIKATERNTIVSRSLEEMPQERRHEEEGYWLAMEQSLAQGPPILKKASQPEPEREEPYGREDFRGRQRLGLRPGRLGAGKFVNTPQCGRRCD